jgi:hypothetical protein
MRFSVEAPRFSVVNTHTTKKPGLSALAFLDAGCRTQASFA